MFKHLSMLFDNQELPSLVKRYDHLRINGDPGEVAALREDIARILKGGQKSALLERAR